MYNVDSMKQLHTYIELIGMQAVCNVECSTVMTNVIYVNSVLYNSSGIHSCERNGFLGINPWH